jgi:hypothetical protein
MDKVHYFPLLKEQRNAGTGNANLSKGICALARKFLTVTPFECGQSEYAPSSATELRQ